MSNSKKVKLENTGERMVPEQHDKTLVYGEHISRYEAAKKIVKGKTVLDIASGSGYGSYMLAEHAKFLYGVDVSKEAVKYAKVNFSRKNLEYLVGDCESIPLDDNSVDVVVTFETIEHVKNYKKFLDEIDRVLKEDGVAIISTPNDLEFAEGNHFHLHEFVRQELLDLITQHFKYTREYFQGSWITSGLFTENEMTEVNQSSFTVHNLAEKGIEQCTYFYVLAARRPIKESVEPNIVLSEHWSGRQHLIDLQNTHDMVENLATKARELDIENDYLRQELKQLNKVAKDQEELFERLSLLNHVKYRVKKALKLK